MPKTTLHDRLRNRLPESLRRLVPERRPPPAPAPPAPPAGPREPPVDTSSSSTFNKGPKLDPNPGMELPDFAKHPEGFVMFNIGDPVELDADPDGSSGATVVSAVHVAGPPRRVTREQVDRGVSPYRELEPGDVQVRGGARGRVVSVSDQTVMVNVPQHEVTIRDGALLPRELKLLEQLFDRQGGWTFGFAKHHVVPLKLEHERVWAQRVVLVTADEVLDDAGAHE